MNITGTGTRSRRSSRRLYVTVMVGVMFVVLCVVFFLYRETETALNPRGAEFDSQRCVRLLAISRVYRIRARPGPDNELWFATAEGIRVFNGETSEWTRYGLDHGLPSEVVSDLCFAGGVPWVGTWKNGIAAFDTAAGRFTPVAFPPGVGAQRVLSVEFVDGAGVFYSADRGGLFQVTHQDSIPRRVPIPGIDPTARITCVKEVDGRLYVGLEGRRLVRYDPGETAFERIRFAGTDSPNTLVWDVLKHGDSLWVATSDEGVYTGRPEEDTLQPLNNFPAKGAYCFSEEEDGLWCGTPFGLWRYHDDGQVWIQFVHPDQEEPTDLEVFALANTPYAVWYGSMDLGTGYFRKENVSWQPMRAGLSRPNVAAIAADGGQLWTGYGYQAGFVDRFKTEGVQYDRNYGMGDGLFDDHIQVMVVADSVLYYGGYEGFGYYDRRRRRFVHYDEENGLPYGDIAAIYCDSTRPHYLGGLFGLIEFYPDTDSFTVVEETRGRRITSIGKQGDSLWLGTLAAGLLVYDLSKRAVVRTYLEPATRIVSCAFFCDSAGLPKTLVATEEDGLHLIDCASGALRSYDDPGGVVRGDPMGVTAARKIGNRIWIGTNRSGCVVLDTETSRWYQYTAYDGLVSDRVRSLYDTDEHVWIGCFGGLNRIEKTYLTKRLL